jgi:hypothetical protein
MFSKFLLAACLVCLCMVAPAQQSAPVYYDVDWKPCDPLLARFVSYTTPLEKGHVRKDYYISNGKAQMVAQFADAEEKIYHGPVKFYYPDGKPSAIGNYFQNKRHGLCVSYHPNGMMSDSGNYNMGVIRGYKLGWHPNGFQSDSIFQRNDSVAVAVFWYNDGSPEMAGYYLHDERDGVWKFFYKGGGISKKAVYKDGEEISAEYFDKDGQSMIEPFADRQAFFKGGSKGWKTYIEKKLYWPSGYKFSEGNQACVSVRFNVDENGKIKDAYVDVPFHPEFDRIALRAISLSEGWQPAIQHNRPVASPIRQLITFSQPD